MTGTFFLLPHKLTEGKGGDCMVKVSLCMIVRDEEAVLARCLQSIQDCVDEIVIVDTGSTDRTAEIAKGFTEKVYDYPWQEDFAAARNFAFSKGCGDYLLWMDADDILPAEEKEKFISLKRELEENPWDVVMMPYDVGIDEAGKPTLSYQRERLLRRCGQAKWVGRVHEVIPPFGKVHQAEIHFQHRKEKQGDPDRNLRIYEKMRQEGKVFDPREQFYYGRELMEHGSYQAAAEELQAFLQRQDGWLENKLEACRLLSDCLRSLGEGEAAFDILLQGLRLAPPTGEHCCRMGQFFLEQEAWEQAVFWYENALHAERRTAKGAFVQEDCYTYLPCIQLCVCYDRLGETELAKMYNEMAGVFRPEEMAVKQNRLYFAEKNKQP